MRTLVVDVHLASPVLMAGLQGRGILVRSLHEFGLDGTPDPDVVRQLESLIDHPWVLVTLDLEILEHHPNFDWGRYAIAWVMLPRQLKGVAVEHAKHGIVHHHAKRIEGQKPGDHFTYNETSQYKHPPSLVNRPW